MIYVKRKLFVVKFVKTNINRLQLRSALWRLQSYSSYAISLFSFLLRKAFEALSDNPNIAILGNDNVSRLPIFSMIIYHQDSGKLVHHNFISVLLNDLYGIQARGGCACAGPYAQVSLKPYKFF